jgi:hypothetical protein
MEPRISSAWNVFVDGEDARLSELFCEDRDGEGRRRLEALDMLGDRGEPFCVDHMAHALRLLEGLLNERRSRREHAQQRGD